MSSAEHSADIEIKLLLEAVYLKYDYDFREYSLASMRRRLSAATVKFGVSSITQLQDKLFREPDFFQALLQYLTISVSEFFRDPDYFLIFRNQIVPFLKTYPSLKIWVAGCCTGEEAYSLAIVLKEEGLLERAIIYATDINPKNLERAKQGIYSLECMRGFENHYHQAGGKSDFSKYYITEYDAAILDSSLSANIVFADHSLATDNVFSETHFISCRNVLIYFDRKLQDRALRLFGDSIVFGGFLGLGKKESIQFSAEKDRWANFDEKNKIYRRNAWRPTLKTDSI